MCWSKYYYQSKFNEQPFYNVHGNATDAYTDVDVLDADVDGDDTFWTLTLMVMIRLDVDDDVDDTFWTFTLIDDTGVYVNCEVNIITYFEIDSDV